MLHVLFPVSRKKEAIAVDKQPHTANGPQSRCSAVTIPMHPICLLVAGTVSIGSFMRTTAAAEEGSGPYRPTWESLDARPTPSWFSGAKFGIFIHWGVYSVPSWGPKGTYAEWYWNALGREGSETELWHHRTYGPGFKYEQFAPMFKAEMFEPAKWADLFAASGAKYVVLTSKHHEGYCLWPCPQRPGWNSVDVGPHRDLAGDLAKAVRGRGLKMGFYYSLYEWEHPLYKTDVNRYVDEYMLPQFKDLVTRYSPSLIFADGEWSYPAETWRSRELLAWLFNESPCREEVVINDRWGKDCRSEHGGYFTSEYGHVGGGKSLAGGRPWEENRGIGCSFGYNRNEDIEDYHSAAELIHLLVDVVSRGGNLLLDVGPTADGRIPVIMQERLLQIGHWLQTNGQAIYGSQRWRVDGEQGYVRYTVKDGVVYAICTKWPGRRLSLDAIKPTDSAAVQLLGREGDLPWQFEDGRFQIDLSAIGAGELPCKNAYVFALTGLRDDFIRFTPQDGCFAEKVEVVLDAFAAWPDVPFAEPTSIRYTLDGSEPTSDSRLYDGPVTLEETTTIRAACFRGDRQCSPSISTQLLVTRRMGEPELPDVHLSDLVARKATSAWKGVKWDMAGDETPLALGERSYEKGVGVHARAELVYDLKPEYKRLVGQVGIHGQRSAGSITVHVMIDGRKVHQSPLIKAGAPPWNVGVDIGPNPDGSLPKQISLVVEDGGDGGANDLTDWCNVGFVLH